MLIGETPEEYISYCRSSVREWGALLQNWRNLAQEVANPAPQLEEIIEDTQDILRKFINQLERAKKGQYE